MRPSWRAHWPPQFTTISALIGPSVVCTPVTRGPDGASSVSIAVTRVFSKMRTPPLRAPLASACVMSVGFALPSPGNQTAPTRSSVRMMGYLSPAWLGVSGSHTTPCALAMATERRRSVMRSSVRATVSEPHCFQPVASPVSASSFE